MKIRIVLLLFLFSFSLRAQDKILIEENDDLWLFETFVSLNSEGNIFPSFLKNGLLYTSNYNSKKYQLFYSDLKTEPIKFKIGSKYKLGAVAVFNNEIYFTGTSKKTSSQGFNNFAIYKGLVNGFKVSNIKQLSICNPNFSYTYPAISKDGNKMVVVSNERGSIHLLEFNRNKNNQWEKGEVIFISQLDYEIINPLIFDENTIYFASNLTDGKITKVLYNSNKKGEVKVAEVEREKGDFNIFKTVKTDVSWGLPQKVEQFNSEFDDLGVLFINDKSGYINTFRYSDADNIYYFELKQ